MRKLVDYLLLAFLPSCCDFGANSFRVKSARFAIVGLLLSAIVLAVGWDSFFPPPPKPRQAPISPANSPQSSLVTWGLPEEASLGQSLPGATNHPSPGLSSASRPMPQPEAAQRTGAPNLAPSAIDRDVDAIIKLPKPALAPPLEPPL